MIVINAHLVSYFQGLSSALPSQWQQYTSDLQVIMPRLLFANARKMGGIHKNPRLSSPIRSCEALQRCAATWQSSISVPSWGYDRAIHGCCLDGCSSETTHGAHNPGMEHSYESRVHGNRLYVYYDAQPTECHFVMRSLHPVL